MASGLVRSFTRLNTCWSLKSNCLFINPFCTLCPPSATTQLTLVRPLSLSIVYLSLKRLSHNCAARNSILYQFPTVIRRKFSTLNEDSNSQENLKNQAKRLRVTAYFLVSSTLFGIGLAFYTWGRPTEESDREYSEYSVILQYILRTYNGAKNYFLSFRDPFRASLLPPPLEHPYIQPKYTLVVEPNGILVHPEWTLKTGWRFKKRPFVDYFLQNCGPPVFESVIFTSDTVWSTASLAESLDPRGNVMHWLFRDATRYIDGKRVKDLNYLNRDLSKVIMIEWDRNACKMNPQNCLIMKKYEGEDNDRMLFELVHFLRTIAIHGVDDVREIISHYSECDDPLAVFRENQRLALEQEEKRRKSKDSSSFVNTFRKK